MTFVYLLLVLIIVKLLHSLTKSDSVNDEEMDIDSDENTPDIKPSIEKPKEFGKNKWLYPTDEYGKMEKGVSGYETSYPKEKKEDRKIKH